MYKAISFDKETKLLRKFVKLEFEMYKDDSDWVPPLIGDTISMLKGKNNPLFDNGPHMCFLVLKGEQVVARVLAGVDNELNKAKGIKQGYFSMFECSDDAQACKVLMDAACKWLNDIGMDSVIGPISPCNGDDRKGFLVWGQGMPVLLNAYTKDYYPRLILEYGFTKNENHRAYSMKPPQAAIERHIKVSEYARKKYGYSVDRLNVRKIVDESKDIKEILDHSVPDNWDYLNTPSLEAVIQEFKTLKQFYNGYYTFIARKKGKPIGFMVALPDYNQVLKRMNGRLLPIGWLKYLYYKRKITGARALVQMVDNKYHNLGVNHAMFTEFYKDWIKTGLEYVEASCVDEGNLPSINSTERSGGVHYRTYRTYKHDLKKAE
ncbi:MAG: hypothetical protein HN389_01415 [Clostridia bacterium]|nr:hypothetical protein [Clostridia bacterium]